MSASKDLLQQISELTIKIKNQYPELIKYLDENPITISSEEDPHVDEKALIDYLDTLKALYKKYKD